MRLRTALWLFLLTLGVVLSGTVYAGFALHKADLTDREAETTRIAAETIAADIESRLNERMRSVEFAASAVDLPGDERRHQQQKLDAFVTQTSFDGASLIDANGTMRAIAVSNVPQSESDRLVGRDFSGRRYVQRALAGDVFISEPVAADSGNLIVTISAPIRANGTIVGAFTGALHVRDTSLFRPSDVSLGSQQALTVRTTNDTLFAADEPLAPGSEDYLTEQHTVDLTGWTVIVGTDRTVLDDQLLVATAAQAGAVSLALLSVALVGIWISRTALSSIDELVAGLTALEDGDYDRELDLGVTDEWVRISETFNALSSTLDQRESQLRVLNRVLRHNLRNDMSVVIAHADAILHGDADDETKAKARTMRRTANRLIDTSTHARTIYEEVLGGEHDPQPVDLVPLVTDEAVGLREQFPESTVETEVPATARAQGREAIPILVEELCRNALLHSDRPPEDRRVRITVEQDDDGCRLVVSDNGPGLPAVERELLTGQREETNIHHGSGLGLWVVRWLADQIGASISVAASDEGTEVTVHLQTANDDQAAH
jgi:signal transduction histidine kinase